MFDAAFRELMDVRNRCEHAAVDVCGADPIYPTRFRIGETGAAALAAVGVGVSDIWELKTGRRQTVSIDVRHAAAAMRSFAYLQSRRPDGSFGTADHSDAAALAHELMQAYRTRDGRWFLPHFGMVHLRDRVLGVLGCEATPKSVATAVSRWDASQLEDAIAQTNACGGIVREHGEWLEHPHGQVLAGKPVVEIEKIGESEPEPFTGAGAVLDGIRVLDLTRVLAGPVAARVCAEHGADVLMVTAENLPQFKNYVIDLSYGKRSCFLDLEDRAQADRLKVLLRDADVFSQGYRPGVLEARGFGPEQLAELRPGLVYVSISCFGSNGPWHRRAGWEQVAQTVIGLCHEHGEERPELLPAPVCDYTTGYLGAYGILLALARRALEGGSYHVKVSLCQSGMFLYRQDRVELPTRDMDVSPAEAESLQMESESSYGFIRQLAPVVRFSDTKPAWSRPSPALGEHQPQWLEPVVARV